jgi:hypothetical protein
VTGDELLAAGADDYFAPVLAAADSRVGALRAAFVRDLRDIRKEVDLADLASAIERANVADVIAAMLPESVELERTAEAWRDAFVAGGKAAARETRSIVQADTERARRKRERIKLAFDAVNPRAVRFALEESAKRVTRITEGMREAIREEVALAFVEGRPPRELARRLIDLDLGLDAPRARSVRKFRNKLEERVEAGEITEARARERAEKYAAAQLRKRALMIARTETVVAAAEGQLELWNQAADLGLIDSASAEKEWTVTPDDRLDLEICEPMNEQRVGLNDAFEAGDGRSVRVPGDTHPGCFLPGTTIAGEVVAGLRAEYAGPAVVVRTRGGRELAVTPNHPVLTPEGFAPVEALHKGRHLLSYRAKVGVGPNPGHDEQPATVEKVFRALRAKGLQLRAPVAVHDLHGDAVHVVGEVDVVLPHRDLGGEPARKVSVDRSLVESAMATSSLDGGRVLRALALAVLPPGRGFPSRRALAFYETAIGFQLRPFQPLRFGSAPKLDAPFDEGAAEGATIGASLARELQERFPGEVSLDEVVEVREVEFRGHVYDLQAAGGWILANGIVASNCRCGVVLVV